MNRPARCSTWYCWQLQGLIVPSLTDSEAELELLEAEQARELELELQKLELQPVDLQGTLTDWLARKILWQASENHPALYSGGARFFD